MKSHERGEIPWVLSYHRAVNLCWLLGCSLSSGKRCSFDLAVPAAGGSTLPQIISSLASILNVGTSVQPWSWLLPPAFIFRWVEDQSSDRCPLCDITCLCYEEGPLQVLQIVVHWSWKAHRDSEWLSPPHHKPFSADFFCVVVIVVHCDLEITFLDAQTCSVKGHRMSVRLWAARSLAVGQSLRHTNSRSRVSPLRQCPPSEAFCPVTVKGFHSELGCS